MGSGNLTFGGYSNNSEFFYCTDLRYDNPQGSALLQAFNEHL